MILDNFLILCGSMSAVNLAMTGQAFNGAGTVVSANSIDMSPTIGNQVSDRGIGERMEISFTIITAPTVGTSCQYQLIEADDAALTVNVTVIDSTGAIPIASLPAGTLIPLNYDRAAPFPGRRYVGAQVVNVGAIATHSVFAGAVKNYQDMKNNLFKTGFAIA